MLELISRPEVWIAFGTLLLLEIVLGIDTIVFISIMAGTLPEARRPRARTTGLSLALITRILLLLLPPSCIVTSRWTSSSRWTPSSRRSGWSASCR